MHPQQKPFLALALRLLAMALLSGVVLFAKLAGEHGMALPVTLFWRQFIPMLLIGGWLAARGELHRLRTDHPRLHLTRSGIGTVNMFFTLGVVQMMPLAEATLLGFTTPIFAVLLSVFLLREKVGRYRWSAVVLGLLGITIMTGADHGAITAAGLAVGLTAAFGVALVSIQIRQMARTEQPVSVVFWFSAIGSIMLAPLLPFYMRTPDLLSWIYILGLGLCGVFAQLLMTMALRYGSVSSVIVMDYSQLFWAALWGWLVFAQLPPAATWLGAPLIIAAGLIIARREQVLARQSAPEATPLSSETPPTVASSPNRR